MLRIIRIVGSSSVNTLKLDGKLLGSWVDEVRNTYALTMAKSSRCCLDLSALTFVDAAGAELLRDLIQSGVAVVACSSYVAELLQLARCSPPSTPGPGSHPGTGPHRRTSSLRR